MASNETTEHGKRNISDKALRRLVRIWTWVGGILLAAVVIYLSGLLSNAIGTIIWTAVFVFILRGPVNWLDKHGVNRTVGTLLAFIMLIAVIGLLLFIVFSPIFGIRDQFAELMNSLPTIVKDFQNWASDFYNKYADVLQSEEVRSWITNTLSSFGAWLQEFATSSAGGIITVGTSLANTIMCIGFALVISFWMLIALPALGREVRRLISPQYQDDADMIHLTVTRVMGGYLKATIIQCFIIGAACGILFAVLGIPSAGAIGVITGLLNIIPIVGPWLGGALAFIVGVPSSAVTAIAALVGTIVLQQLVYTFLSPKLMGDSVDIHPALTFIALLAGSGIGTAMGGLGGALVGALLSIPLVAMLKAFFVYYFEKRTGRRIVAEDGVFFKGAAPKDDEVNPIADATAPMPPVAPGATGAFPSLTGKLPIIDLDDANRNGGNSGNSGNGGNGGNGDDRDRGNSDNRPAHRK